MDTDGLGTGVTATTQIARGSTFTVTTTAGVSRIYTVADTIQNAGGGDVQFVFTPALEEVVQDGDSITFNVGSTHVITADFDDGGDDIYDGLAAPSLDAIVITPALGSDYRAGSTVSVMNAINNSDGEYFDAFGNNGGAAVAAGTEIEVALGGASNELTVTINSDTNNTNIDFSGYFNDLSHNSATSEDATATSPDLYTDYQMLQDPKFNSWMRVEQYDNYDNGMGPLLVADDQLGPKVLVNDSLDVEGNATIGMENDASRTFLYPVNDITITAAHVNVNLGDDDIIFTAAGGETTVAEYMSSTTGNSDQTNATALQNAVDDDYPLFLFWGINNTGNVASVNNFVTANDVDATSTDTPADNQNLVGGASAVTDSAGLFKLAIKLSSTPTTNVTTTTGAITAPAGVGTGITTRAFIYAPGNTNDDIGTLAGGGPTDIVYLTDTLTYNNAGVAVASGTDSQVNVIDDYLLIAMPDYATPAELTKEDKLVIDDVLIADSAGNNKVYTIVINIPQFTASNSSTAMSEAVTNSSAGLFSYQVYRKVNLADETAAAGNALLSNVDFSNLTSGTNQINTVSRSVSVPYREHLDEGTAGNISASWSRGVDYAGATTTTDTANFTPVTADVPNTAPTAGNDATVDVTLTYNSETNAYIGHDAQLAVKATDFDGNPSNVTLTFKLGHGLSIDFDRDDFVVQEADGPVILNTIDSSDNAVD
jgi:hypothetical protein